MKMQKLSAIHKTATTLRALRFVGLRLGSRPETKGLLPALQGVRAELVQKQDEYEVAHEERVALTAEMLYLDQQVDEGVMRLSKELLAQENRRDTARFLAFFPISPTEATKPHGGAAQHRAVHGLLDVLGQEAAAGVGSLQHHAAPLREAQAALEQAEVRREALYVQEGRAKAQRDAAWRQAQKHHNMLYPQLQLLFPDDPALVESFFRALYTPAQPQPDDEQDA
jgi:hypothetical protein